jgi:hypothetical protein
MLLYGALRYVRERSEEPLGLMRLAPTVVLSVVWLTAPGRGGAGGAKLVERNSNVKPER